jgi:hypothetical protein
MRAIALLIAAIAILKLTAPTARARADLRVHAATMANDVTDAVRALRKSGRKRPPFTIQNRKKDR